MTREELYQTIYTHDTIYLPPREEGCAALEVCLGCSWHRCTFCDFAKDKFQILPLTKIEYNLKVLGKLQPDNDRLFMLGENAFCINTMFLLSILELVEKYMPKVKTFSMYSRIDDILRKSDSELALLKSKGLKNLHIGVESGSDSVLAERKKGITSTDILNALRRLDLAGINYYLTIIPGLGGRTFSRMNALETASLLNKVHPKDIWCLKLKLWENTPLYKEYKNGLFDMMTDEEMLLEERLLLANLNMTDCIFEDTTVLNKYTITGNLPEQKDQLLQAIDYLIEYERKLTSSE